jgi:hypothetical protein
MRSYRDEMPRLGSLFDHVAGRSLLEDIRYLLEHRFSESPLEILMPERMPKLRIAAEASWNLVERLVHNAFRARPLGIQRRQRVPDRPRRDIRG